MATADRTISQFFFYNWQELVLAASFTPENLMVHLKVPPSVTAFTLHGQPIALERDIMDVHQEQLAIWQSHGFEPTTSISCNRRDLIEQILRKIRSTIEILSDEHLTTLSIAINEEQWINNLLNPQSLPMPAPISPVSPPTAPAKAARKPKA